MLSGGSRLQTQAVWSLITFLLEGVVFVLIGLQLPAVVRGLRGYAVADIVGWSVAVVLTVLLVRPLRVFPATYLPRRLSAKVRARDPVPPWQLPAAVSWAAMRGVVSLAAAVALPLTDDAGRPFPQRDLLVFVVFVVFVVIVVIVVTLLVQGLTFGPVLRRLGLRADRRGALLQQAGAQQAASAAAVQRLDEVLAERPAPDGIGDTLRTMASHRSDSAWERAGSGPRGDGDALGGLPSAPRRDDLR